MNKIVRVFGSFRGALLATAVGLSILALSPALPARAGAPCGAPWTISGCCLANGHITERQQQTCCDSGSCYTNYRCTNLVCPV
jgi:hypothetical protein